MGMVDIRTFLSGVLFMAGDPGRILHHILFTMYRLCGYLINALTLTLAGNKLAPCSEGGGGGV